MKYKLVATLVSAALGWSVWAGGLSAGVSLPGHDLEIDVAADPDSIAEAVGDLPADGFAKAVGAPGADATADAVYLRRNSDGWSWLVRGDSGLAVQLDVVLEPLLEGGTRVRTRVSPGQLDGPALALAQKLQLRSAFADGIQAELDPLLPADRRLPPGQVEARKRAAGDAIVTVQAAASPQSVGTAGHALVDAQSRLEEETAEIAWSDEAGASNALAEAEPAPEVGFEPGQPMVVAGGE
jgi:hypothetical protein